MAYTEFTCRSGGSNLYAGSLDGSAEASTTPLVTYTNGGWNSGTGVFTPASGDPVLAGVATGQWVSVYTDGSGGPTGFVARVTAVSSTTITLSTTAKSGTAPTTAASGITAVVGGAWAGPSGTSGFPLNFAASTMTDSTGNPPRINFKSNQTYAVTAAITAANNGPLFFQGYTSTFGDLGRATIDGGNSGAAYIPLAITGTNVSIADLIFNRNGASSNAFLVNASASEFSARRCVFSNSRGGGLTASGSSSLVAECEVFACNLANAINSHAFLVNGSASNAVKFTRCIAHDNTGSNTAGFGVLGGTMDLFCCVSETNGGSGVVYVSSASLYAQSSDFYNNTSHGISFAPGGIGLLFVENCNFVKNGGYGINLGGNASPGFISNCGFGAGTQVNTSGQVNTAGNLGIQVSGSVTYASDVTPWVDPANGDFRINLAAAKNTGRGLFTQTASSYAGTVGYPDIGAAQHLDAGGLRRQGMGGGVSA